MSGHSHYATIKRQKEVRDSAKGKTFSKLARAIALAAKSQGPDPSSNYKLRMVIEQAKSANMPKANIDRVLEKAKEVGEKLEEVTYEGYGPFGIAVVVEVASDNKNRTGQEIKNIFERVGGSLAGPGAVSYIFEPKGLLLIKKDKDPDTQTLQLIDFGVEDIEETDDNLEVYVPPSKTTEMKEKLENEGFTVDSMDLEMKAKNYVTFTDVSKIKKALDFLDVLESHDDVQKVFANLDIPQNISDEIKS